MRSSVSFHYISDNASVVSINSMESMDSMESHGYPWISMDIHGDPWISMDFHGDLQRDLQGSHPVARAGTGEPLETPRGRTTGGGRDNETISHA